MTEHPDIRAYKHIGNHKTNYLSESKKLNVWSHWLTLSCSRGHSVSGVSRATEAPQVSHAAKTPGNPVLNTSLVLVTFLMLSGILQVLGLPGLPATVDVPMNSGVALSVGLLDN